MSPQDGICGPLTTNLILQIPDTIFVCELLVAGAALGQDAALKATHVEEQIGVVLAVHGHKAVLPLHRGHRAGQAVFDVPEDSATTEGGGGIKIS